MSENGDEKVDLLKKFGIDADKLPEDTEALILIIRSPSKGLLLNGTTINDRVMAYGMLGFGLEEALKRYWLNQDMVQRQQEMQKMAIQEQILNPGIRRG